MPYATKNLCQDQDGACSQCGHKMTPGLRGRQCPAAAQERGRPEPPIVQSVKPRKCKENKPGLGDLTERWLTKIGVTKERYIEAKQMFGLAPTCNCEKRKEWLNSVIDWWRGQP